MFAIKSYLAYIVPFSFYYLSCIYGVGLEDKNKSIVITLALWVMSKIAEIYITFDAARKETRMSRRTPEI